MSGVQFWFCPRSFVCPMFFVVVDVVLHGTVVNRFRYNGLLDTFVFCLMHTKYPSGTFVNKQMKKMRSQLQLLSC